MKPRIFINMHYMALGGAERALLGLLNAIDAERVDVDLFLNQHEGEFLRLIPKKINLLPERRRYNAIERPMTQIIKEGQLSIAWARLKARWQHRKYRKTLNEDESSFDGSAFQYIADCVDPYLSPLDDLGEYDLAISFLQPHNVVLNKVKAKKKVAWIHTDYSKLHVNIKKELPVWGGFDHVVSISHDCTRTFLEAFPSLESKIVEVENILSPEFVRKQAEQFATKQEMSYGGVKLLSVGRFCHPKNYDNVPDIAKRIITQGVTDLRWYIIGFGPDEDIIRAKVAEASMEDHVFIIGKKENPYPYIEACDIYVQPSRYEGKSVTVREAQILCKPVIITNYATAKSQVKDGIDGIIVPMDNEGCAKGIVEVIRNSELLKSISSYLSSHDYGNEREIEKIYQLI